MRHDTHTQLRALLYEDPATELWQQIVDAVASLTNPADRSMAIMADFTALLLHRNALTMQRLRPLVHNPHEALPHLRLHIP